LRIALKTIERKAIVFPEPDGAWTIKLLPCIPWGIDKAWI